MFRLLKLSNVILILSKEFFYLSAVEKAKTVLYFSKVEMAVHLEGGKKCSFLTGEESCPLKAI